MPNPFRQNKISKERKVEILKYLREDLEKWIVKNEIEQRFWEREKLGIGADGLLAAEDLIKRLKKEKDEFDKKLEIISDELKETNE